METISQDIITLVASTPAIVLTDPKRENELLEHIRAEIKAFVPNLTTAKGRKEIGSLAFKISRTKTAIDEAGDKMVEDARAIVAKINGDRKRIREILDGLRDEARKPLDDWETAEAARAQLVADTATRLRAAALVPLGTKPAAVKARLLDIEAMAFDPDVFKDQLETTSLLRDSVITALKVSIEQLTAAEAEKAELETLRIANEAQKRELEAAAEASAEKDRLAVQREAEAASAAGAHEQKLAAEAIASANERADAAVAVVAKMAEPMVPTAPTTDRRKVVGAAAAALEKTGITSQQAMTIVLAILARQIPNVTLTF